MKNTFLNDAWKGRVQATGQWFTHTKRHLLFVPHQTPAAQMHRPTGIFGILVSPYL